MDTTALKKFAPAVRRQLMEAVERKLDVVLNARTPDYLTTYSRQVETLRKLADEDRDGLVERVAYTWFNRLAALRYLDARGWHPFRSRVLTPASPEETQPELLRVVRTSGVPEELASFTDPHRIDGLLDGRVPSADPQGEVYRHLVLAACRYYHGLLPDLFESLDDETELLLPDDLLTEHSVAHGFRTEITDEDCEEVEVLGWLYQFYISEKKDEVMARKKAVPSEDIPAVTQLFTPHWIVRYLVENSLGRLWLLNRPGSKLKERMPYYIENEEEETDFLRIERPEEIKVIDPAVGSGHMLTYAFDLLYAIYEEEGYAPSEIARLILKHNLYGVDIDPRAAQLASLALVLKARERSRRFFQPEVRVRPNIIAMRDVRFEPGELREYVRALDLGPLFDEPVLELMRQFENATTFGSLIQPVLGEKDIQQLRRRIEERELGSELFLAETHEKVLRVLKQAEYLTQRYQVVVANPPYMGSNVFNSNVKEFITRFYAAGRYDLYAAFIQRNLTLVHSGGLVAMITMPNWMFLRSSSFEALRTNLLSKSHIVSLIHNGRGVWGADFGSVAFVVCNMVGMERRGVYRRLFRSTSEVASNHALSQRFLNKGWGAEYLRSSEFFSDIPGHILAYWLSEKCRAHFKNLPALGTVLTSREGMATGNNDRFLRAWHEVSLTRIGFGYSTSEDAIESGCRWFPYNKGGEYRKWFGNNELVVDWENDGVRIRSFKDERTGRTRSHNYNGTYAFRPGITWSALSISRISVRLSDKGFLFDSKGAKAFAESNVDVYMALINSVVGEEFLRALSPGIDFKVGDIIQIPLLKTPTLVQVVSNVTTAAVNLSRRDWDNFETSWDFRDLPLLRPELKGRTLAESWAAWKDHCDAAIRRMQELETENNRLWIEAYGLEDELSPEVPEEEITLARADRRKDMAAFLSYAIGCMMGRYSLDKPGLILADAESTLEDYLEKVGKPLEELTFAPDADGIIPVLDGEWFEDDVVARVRDFLRATFGEETLRENIRFIEESLGKDLRRYFLTDFYKDHLQTYKKRPIYWMVQSPKKGFSALIYLHRYNRDTLNVVLNRYLREYEAKIRSRLEHLARVQADPGASARDKTAARKEADKLTKVLNECQEWERQTLLPLAQERIELDLDDGVKVNYGKLGEALAPIPGLKSNG